MNNFSFDSEAEAIRVLTKEGKRLEKIAKSLWNRYLSSYKPEQYVRTGDSLKSIKLGSIENLGNNTYGIRLTFQNDLVYHNSRFKNGKKGHSIMLISDGWHSKKLEQKVGRKIHRFTYFEGDGYLYQVYKEFYSSKHRGIDIDINWSGKVQR